ncbi:hypothetical protein Sinac_6450 [Singulisphaera acidiphila DSM 18658]|uniref:Uncharacterized protein n=1 Tax=Singulisphaera acidiphila (strain ATCC BAA-1392 / DSM 18658 / VKM B-2454 / MOB10) TaxID=886293 RepID=L0DNU9_SINAD|nr:hypothetical protein Sinac_6450 [Singulisphaera acidiphila DSM 18658]
MDSQASDRLPLSSEAIKQESHTPHPPMNQSHSKRQSPHNKKPTLRQPFSCPLVGNVPRLSATQTTPIVYQDAINLRTHPG